MATPSCTLLALATPATRLRVCRPGAPVANVATGFGNRFERNRRAEGRALAVNIHGLLGRTSHQQLSLHCLGEKIVRSLT